MSRRGGGRITAGSSMAIIRRQSTRRREEEADEDNGRHDGFGGGGGGGGRGGAAFADEASTAGPVFRRRMRDHEDDEADGSWTERVPVVEVSIKVLQLTDVNVAEQTFRVCFLLYLEWFDSSIREVHEAARARQDHFVPCVAFENNVGEVQTIGDADVRAGDCAVGHMKFIRKYAGTFRSRATVKEYPFDHQFLNIIVKSRRVAGSAVKVVLFNPLRFQGYGHRIDADADWLAEWSLVRVRGANLREVDKTYPYFDQYLLQVEIRRDSLNTNINSAFVIFVVTVLSNIAFAIPVDELADRVSLDLTAFLTVVAFKWIIATTLPKVPYMTTLDVYIFLSFVNLFLQGVYFFGIALVFKYLGCETADIYAVARSDAAAANLTGGGGGGGGGGNNGTTNRALVVDPLTGAVNCPGVAIAEWTATVFSLVFVLAAQAYYIWKFKQAQSQGRQSRNFTRGAESFEAVDAANTSSHGLSFAQRVAVARALRNEAVGSPRATGAAAKGSGGLHHHIVHPASSTRRASVSMLAPRTKRFIAAEQRFNFNYALPHVPQDDADAKKQSVAPRRYAKAAQAQPAPGSGGGSGGGGGVKDPDMERKRALADASTYADKPKAKAE